MDIFVNNNKSISDWCQGKSWLTRVPILFFMVYIFYQNAVNPNYFGILGYFNLIMHEAGHWIFMPFGETMMTLGGSLMQIIVPIVFLIAFWRQPDYFGVSFCLVWLGDNLFSIAAYVGDASARILPLLGGDASGHDWYNLLSQWNILNYDTTLAGIIRLLAGLIMTAGLVLGFWILWRIYKSKTDY